MGYVSLCLWREARSEGEDGIRGVMHVIRKRALTWYKSAKEPYHACIFSHAQFTSMSDPADPEYSLFPSDTDSVYMLCQRIAQDVIAGHDTDNTGGALYYANLDNITPGGWFAKYILSHPETHPPTVKIGRHTFFA